MRRLALCASAALLLCLALMPRVALAQTGIKVVEEDVVLTRTSYPPVKPSEGPVRIYAGEWSLNFEIHNYDVTEGIHYAGATDVKAKIFLDNVLLGEAGFWSWEWNSIRKGESEEAISTPTISISRPGEHEVRIEIWHGDETQPQDEYRFNVTALKPEVSGLQASSKVVRALGENSLGLSFTNGGNENMRQAVLSVADSGGLTVTPSEVELGDVRAGESASANFTVSSPAGITLGTTIVRFSLSFIDYAGIPHTEDVSGEVEVYRLMPTLTVSAPASVENGSTVEIAATLKDPGGNPIANENITLAVGGVTLGVFKTGSDGIARASYRATETGTFDVGASFLGSASYETSSASAGFEVTPAAFPLWIILLAILIVIVWLGAYLKRRRPRREHVRR